MPATWRYVSYGGRRLRRPLRRYAAKFRGRPGPIQPAPSLAQVCLTWLGGLLAIACLGWLTEATGAPLLLASFGASCVLLFGYPESPFSQPRNTVGGHLIAAAIGLGGAALGGAHWWAMALVVATAIGAMKLSRTVHPPAGSTAIIAFHLHPGPHFLVAPVLAGAALLVLVAALYNNVIEHRRYPQAWW